MAIKYLAGKRIQGTTAERTALNLASPPATSWKELGRASLSSAGDIINSGTFTAKDNIMILQHNMNSNAVRTGLRFNADSGNNYAHRRQVNGGSDATNTSHNRIVADTDIDGSDFTVSEFKNISAQEKLGILHRVHQSGTGAGNAPDREEMVGKWVNTSSRITSIQSVNTETGDFDTGSEIVVLGFDDDEADSGTNFWQELASVELSSTTSEIDLSFTAKKYLMMRYYTNASTDMRWRVGTGGSIDTGNNYHLRYNSNGGSDSTLQYSSFLQHNTIVEGEVFIINKSDKEKLIIQHEVGQNTAGAGNVPNRREDVGKWANTSGQIDTIKFFKSGQTFNSGSFVKVWGAD